MFEVDSFDFSEVREKMPLACLCQTHFF